MIFGKLSLFLNFDIYIRLNIGTNSERKFNLPHVTFYCRKENIYFIKKLDEASWSHAELFKAIKTHFLFMYRKTINFVVGLNAGSIFIHFIIITTTSKKLYFIKQF